VGRGNCGMKILAGVMAFSQHDNAVDAITSNPKGNLVDI
jgi:hypothetical protein